MLPIDEAEPLKEEIRSFLHSVRTGTPPKVGGEEGARALGLASASSPSIASQPVPG